MASKAATWADLHSVGKIPSELALRGLVMEGPIGRARVMRDIAEVGWAWHADTGTMVLLDLKRRMLGPVEALKLARWILDTFGEPVAKETP